MANPNRQIVLTMPLVAPIPWGGAMINELAFYNPTATVLGEIESNTKMGEQALAIVSDLTEIPIVVLNLLDLEDAFKAVAIGGDIIEKKSEAAKIYLKSIGILEGDEEDDEVEETNSETVSPPQPLTVAE